jgi:hypothetical protein
MNRAAVPVAITEVFEPVHYEDTFTASVRRQTPITLDELNQAFRKAMPWWVLALLGLRNLLVGWTGLKTGRGKKREGYGLFDLFTEISRTDDVAFLGDDDRHLDFRVLVRVRNAGDEKAVDVTTLVRFNRREGRVYFFFVKPFHKLIVVALMRRVARVLRP